LRGWSPWQDRESTLQRFESGPFAGPRTWPEHPSQWAAITSIAGKFGCTAETLRNWVRQAERDSGQRGGLTTDERQRLKELERDNRELRRANEILRKASAYFAQAELDRRPK
jgi:transposase